MHTLTWRELPTPRIVCTHDRQTRQPRRETQGSSTRAPPVSLLLCRCQQKCNTQQQEHTQNRRFFCRLSTLTNHSFPAGLSKVQKRYRAVQVIPNVFHASVRVCCLSPEQCHPFQSIKKVVSQHLGRLGCVWCLFGGHHPGDKHETSPVRVLVWFRWTGTEPRIGKKSQIVRAPHLRNLCSAVNSSTRNTSRARGRVDTFHYTCFMVLPNSIMRFRTALSILSAVVLTRAMGRRISPNVSTTVFAGDGIHSRPPLAVLRAAIPDGHGASLPSELKIFAEDPKWASQVNCGCGCCCCRLL